jgi:predicted methyltransferase
MMNPSSLLMLAVMVALPIGAVAATPPPTETTDVPSYVTAAINAPARAADKADDARRQLAAVMTFTGLEPGQSVLELVPGSGYWTRVFSAIVGPTGHVYTVWPHEMGKYAAKSLANWQTLVKSPPYENVSILEQPAAELTVPKPVDLVFTSQNYHDYYDPFMGPVDMTKFNKQVYAALKPGGSFVVIDHVAPAGSGTADTNTLHRIDPAQVKKDAEAAGFVFAGESDVLRNPADSHETKVFDPVIRGHTDQFIYRFRKPAK